MKIPDRIEALLALLLIATVFTGFFIWVLSWPPLLRYGICPFDLSCVWSGWLILFVGLAAAAAAFFGAYELK